MKYGTGALESGYDLRDFWYEPADKGVTDWVTGYDIEEIIGTKLVTKDQNGSGSCGGQAWAYYGEVLERVATNNYEPRSARWIYSHTFVPPGGGSRGRDNCDHVIKKGWVQEKYATSYDNGKPPKESFMRVVPTLTKEAIEDNEVSKALSYLKIKPNIEIIAQAIQDNYGVILSVQGQDNGTWHSAFPKVTKVKEWNHWLYAGRYRKINGKKYIGVKNSWGDDVGEDGWQWISEDFFTNGFIREGWTLQWDYKPAKHKLVLIQLVKSLQALVGAYKELIKKQHV